MKFEKNIAMRRVKPAQKSASKAREPRLKSIGLILFLALFFPLTLLANSGSEYQRVKIIKVSTRPVVKGFPTNLPDHESAKVSNPLVQSELVKSEKALKVIKKVFSPRTRTKPVLSPKTPMTLINPSLVGPKNSTSAKTASAQVVPDGNKAVTPAGMGVSPRKSNPEVFIPLHSLHNMILRRAEIPPKQLNRLKLLISYSSILKNLKSNKGQKVAGKKVSLPIQIRQEPATTKGIHTQPFVAKPKLESQKVKLANYFIKPLANHEVELDLSSSGVGVGF